MYTRLPCYNNKILTKKFNCCGLWCQLLRFGEVGGALRPVMTRNCLYASTKTGKWLSRTPEIDILLQNRMNTNRHRNTHTHTHTHTQTHIS